MNSKRYVPIVDDGSGSIVGDGVGLGVISGFESTETTRLCMVRFVEHLQIYGIDTFTVRFEIYYAVFMYKVMQNSPIVGNRVGAIVGDGVETGVGSVD